MNKKMYIMRGLPGSGKSTKIKEMISKLPTGETYSVCSADTFMVDKVGRRQGYSKDRIAEYKAYIDLIALRDKQLFGG